MPAYTQLRIKHQTQNFEKYTSSSLYCVRFSTSSKQYTYKAELVVWYIGAFLIIVEGFDSGFVHWKSRWLKDASETPCQYHGLGDWNFFPLIEPGKHRIDISFQFWTNCASHEIPRWFKVTESLLFSTQSTVKLKPVTLPAAVRRVSCSWKVVVWSQSNETQDFKISVLF